MSSLSLDDLTVGYRRRGKPSRTVLANLGARAAAGELTVLLGPNGTGKSTLLRTICGLQAPLGGQVILDGAHLSALSWSERAKRIAVLLTDRIDPGLLSTAELVGLGRHPHTGLSGRLTGHDRQVISWALEAVDATALAERRVIELSDGERQRVLTARALAQDPAVILMDEPTAFLDMPSRVGLTALLRTLAHERDLAVVMSTHDLELALRVADVVWLIDRHGALRTGSPEELTMSGAIADTFNNENLHLDVTGGVFVLRHTMVGTVRIDAAQPERALIGRALARHGWHEIDTGPSDLEVIAVDGRYDLRNNGQHTSHPDIPALAAKVNRPPTATDCLVQGTEPTIMDFGP